MVAPIYKELKADSAYGGYGRVEVTHQVTEEMVEAIDKEVQLQTESRLRRVHNNAKWSDIRGFTGLIGRVIIIGQESSSLAGPLFLPNNALSTPDKRKSICEQIATLSVLLRVNPVADCRR